MKLFIAFFAGLFLSATAAEPPLYRLLLPPPFFGSTLSGSHSNIFLTTNLVTASPWLTQNTGKLLGRSTAGVGGIEEITLGTGLSFSGTTLNGTATTSLPISSLTAALSINTITNFDYAQVWLWSMTNGANGIRFGESVKGASTNPLVLIDTKASSATIPFMVSPHAVEAFAVREDGRVSMNAIPYTWPGAPGGASYLKNDGGNTLSWAQTITLSSSTFANQGTTTTVLHGNASGNPSFGAVALATDVSGTLASGQFPALTGDTTTSAGSLATTTVAAHAPTIYGQVLLSATNNIIYPLSVPALGSGNTNVVIDFSVSNFKLSTTTNMLLIQSTNRCSATNAVGSVLKIAADGGNVIVRWNASWTNLNGVVTSPVTITNGNWGFFSFYCDGPSETNVTFAFAYR